MSKHMHDIIIRFCKEPCHTGMSFGDIKTCIVRSKLEAPELEKRLEAIINTSKTAVTDFYTEVLKVAESQGILKIPLRDFEVANIYY